MQTAAEDRLEFGIAAKGNETCGFFPFGNLFFPWRRVSPD